MLVIAFTGRVQVFRRRRASDLKSLPALGGQPV